MNSTIIKKSIQSFTYVYDPSFKKGIKYTSLSLGKVELFDVDSLLKNRAFKDAYLYTIKHEKLIKTKK